MALLLRCVLALALLALVVGAPIGERAEVMQEHHVSPIEPTAVGLIVFLAVSLLILCADGGDGVDKRMAAVDDMALSRRATMHSSAQLESGAASFINETANPLFAQAQEEKLKAEMAARDAVAAELEDEGVPAGRRRSTLRSSYKLRNTPNWIHETLNRRDAERLLRERTTQNGTFLVRAKKPEDGLYALDIGNLNDAGEVMISHHVISRAETGQYLLDDQVFDRFNSMESLMGYLMRPGNKALRKGYLTHGIPAENEADLSGSDSAAC